ncbi:MAG TPA: class I SAM-dependent methyltransferase [Candidatus Saccharimonadales bacterium]|nr:class I SAM-dependent methyltransferase [Candidatus Saccharimonadales bacterium]
MIKLPEPLKKTRRVIKARLMQAREARFLKQELGKPLKPWYDPTSLGDRLREKVWLWLTEKQNPEPQEWAENWIDTHPAKSIGTHNLRYREEWLEEALKRIPKGSRILDAGAGELQYKRFCKHLDYVSQDFGQYTGTGDDKGLQMGSWDNSSLDIVSDITDIPVKSKSFDAIMCVEVFEHIPKPIDALKEFYRILKPGGQLIITTPFASLTHFAPYYFYNGYSRYFYEKLLPELGFEIVELDFNGNYFEYLGQELRRLDEIATKYAPKAKAQSYLDELVKQWLLRRLEKLSSKDIGSNELLVQGLHVLAEKK